jgi:predicted amidohydrolase
VGAAGVFAPADRGLPDDGVVALGALGAPGWLVADLDLDALECAGRDGQVLGHRDWDRDAHLTGDVARATLAP